MFEPEIFLKQMYCIEESTCNIFETFQRPHSDLAPGKLFPPRYAPASTGKSNVGFDYYLVARHASTNHGIQL